MLRLFLLRYGIEKLPMPAYRLASNFSRYAELDFEGESEDLPRITCPKKLRDKLESHHKKKFEGKMKKSNPKVKGPLIISCKRKDYNFHHGENWDGVNVHKLVSCGWKNSKRVGDHFTLVPHLANPSLDEDSEITTFQELGINEKLCAGLHDLGFSTPTAIQKHAIPSLLRGDNAVCAAETGSGKTLAYLLPVVEWVLRQKNSLKMHDEISHTRSPNSVIITPNRELTQQVMSVAESLTPYADFMPQCILGGETQGRSRRYRAVQMDVLFSTPGALRKLLKARHIHGKNLQHLVIDESDTLLDDSFASDIQEILQLLQLNPAEEVDSQLPLLGGTQIVLVSATMPRNLEHALGNILPPDSLNKISTQSLHQLQPHVSQKFIRINPASKPEKVIQLLKEDAEKNQSTLVFTNNNKTCYFVAKLLEENGIDSLRMSGEMAQRDRRDVFQKFKEGYSNILVATDIASRGLDTTNVHHVINYDFPTFMSDYIHRVGRVGRVGVKHVGHVTSFVTHKWDVELLWRIETAARKHTKLDKVNANIKRMLQKSESKAGAMEDEFELNIL